MPRPIPITIDRLTYPQNLSIPGIHILAIEIHTPQKNRPMEVHVTKVMILSLEIDPGTLIKEDSEILSLQQ